MQYVDAAVWIYLQTPRVASGRALILRADEPAGLAHNRAEPHTPRIILSIALLPIRSVFFPQFAKCDAEQILTCLWVDRVYITR